MSLSTTGVPSSRVLTMAAQGQDEEATALVASNAAPVHNLLKSKDINWHSFIQMYNHISAVEIRWSTQLSQMVAASQEQIDMLIDELMVAGYPTAATALRRHSRGSEPCLDVVVDDHQHDKMSHVILVYRRELVRGVEARRVCLLRFKQATSISYVGLCLAMGIGAVSLMLGAPTGAAAAAFMGKLALDFGVSKKDVAIVAAIKELQSLGLLVEVNRYSYNGNSNGNGDGRSSGKLLLMPDI